MTPTEAADVLEARSTCSEMYNRDDTIALLTELTEDANADLLADARGLVEMLEMLAERIEHPARFRENEGALERVANWRKKYGET